MSDNQVEEVKLKTDIVSVIGDHVELKKAGINFKANCPFHSEKTPSFIVSPELQRYKCFGCGVSGDVFNFLQEHEGMDFTEALKNLAERAGVKLKPLKGGRSDKTKMIEVNDLLSKFYHYILLKHPIGKPALKYIVEERGLTTGTIETFQLGFSPKDISIFRKFIIQKKKIRPKRLETLGVFYQGRQIDRFNGRIIFPLADHRGNTVGFAGRILPIWDTGKVGKYINSPETPLYHKSLLLFGLNVTRGDIKKSKEAIFVEGELDFLSVWQAGIKNVVAIKGTAITREQALLIRRFADKIILALDADIAGDSAARRGISIAESAGLEVRVAVLDEYKDPDEAVRKDLNGFKKVLGNSVPVWDFLIDSAISRHGASSGSAKSKVSKEIVPILASIEDSIVQAHYVGYVARKLNVPAEAVSKQVSMTSVDKQKPDSSIKEQEGENVLTRREMIEQNILSLAFNKDPVTLLSPDLLETFQSSFARKVLEQYLDYKKRNKKYDLSEFYKSLPKELKEKFSAILLKQSENEGKESVTLNKEFTMLVKELEILDLKQRLDLLTQEIRKFEQLGKKAQLKKAQKEFSILSANISKISQN